MTRRAWGLLLVVLVVPVLLYLFVVQHKPLRPAPARQQMAFAELGDMDVVSGGEAGLVVMLVDDAWMPEAARVADSIADSGNTAVLVNMDLYFSHVAREKTECLDSVTLLDVLVQQVQQNLRFSHVVKPVLLGMGTGAAYVPLVLQQARAGIFAEGISVGPPASFLLPVPPCGAAARSVGWQSPTVPVAVPRPDNLPTRWRVLPDDGAVPVVAVQAAVDPASEAAVRNNVSSLPLIELPASGDNASPLFAVVLSGDGGWANIDKDIGEALVGRGIPVVGWNSLKYFWQRKTPEVMANDLDMTIRHYQQLWHKQQVLLIGFSLGADVLPFMLNRLPPDSRRAVVGMVLLSPSTAVDFQFQVTDWVDSSSGTGDTPLAPEIDRLKSLPLLCIYGKEDDEGACPSLQGKPASQVVQLPGDHHFDGDYETVTRLILQRFLSRDSKS